MGDTITLTKFIRLCLESCQMIGVEHLFALGCSHVQGTRFDNTFPLSDDNHVHKNVVGHCSNQ